MKRNDFRVTREETRTSSPTESNNFILSSMDKQMQGNRAKESMRTAEWTDEKHSMYIKSIEASFVNQLYDSKQMKASSFSHKGTPYGPPTTSGQFKVLRGGSWQKISFERESRMNNNQCMDLTANPWIQHYRSSTKQGSVAVPPLGASDITTSQIVDLGQRKGISSGSGHLHLCESHVCHQDMLCSDTEMSDQNFVDEEVKGKKENKKSNVKRKKSLRIEAKGSDQMVPLNNSSIGDVTKNCVSAA